MFRISLASPRLRWCIGGIIAKLVCIMIIHIASLMTINDPLLWSFFCSHYFLAAIVLRQHEPSHVPWDLCRLRESRKFCKHQGS